VTEPTPQLAPFEREFLALESAASLPYTRFTYGAAALADQVRDLLFARGVGEFVPPAGKLLIVDGQPAGMVACLSGAALKRARLAAGAALVRSGILASPAVARRVQLAAATLLKPSADDFYLSRIAVADAFRGRGVGAALLRYVLDEAARAKSPRCVLEVAPEATAAIALYRRHGFEEIGRAAVEDPDSGGSLEYVHMQRQVAGPH
jgi:ribosomal protein S18 acetylase RimI-like enzyme